MLVIASGSTFAALLAYQHESSGFDEGKLMMLVKELEKEGFEAYETSVGGGGYGVMIPADSGSGSASALGEKEAGLQAISSGSELPRWSDAGAGQWIFS